MRIVIPGGVRKGLWLGVGVAAVAASAATGASGVTSVGGTITTIAGTGKAGFSGDGGPATSARLANPTGVAVDRRGNVYIADSTNARVRKVSPDGTITTIAGTGKPGFSGDGGPATSARLMSTQAVAVDAPGNVYVVDYGNHRVRKVSVDGVITTIAGTGKPGFSGDGGPATSAKLNYPQGLTVDAKGNIYIADTSNSRVRRVNTNGTITTFAGTGKPGSPGDGGRATSATLSGPTGVAVDGSGNVYIADFLNYRVRKVSPGGTISTIAGTGGSGSSGDGGRATAAELIPTSVALDRQRNVYIGDFHKDRVRKVSPGGTITTFAGTGIRGSFGDDGPASSAQLYDPSGVAVDAQGNVYIADTHNSRVRKVWKGPAPVAPVSGSCSKATAVQLVEQLRLGNAGFMPNPVAEVLCGAFVGPGSRAMVASLAIPSCGRTGGWVVFRWTGTAWQLVLTRYNGADLDAVGSDIRETQFVLRPTDSHCFPTGGTRSRTWHWNGSRFLAGPWKQVTKGEPERRGFYSPSRNIACGMFDDSSYRYVNCQSRVPPQNVTMDASGRLTICRDPTPNNVNNDCNIGDPGEGVIPVLAYGRQITVGRFRCLSREIGVRCTVIRSGTGFLINRDGVSRVGP